ncbi:VOC family protein [Listeria sp. ILCC792]|uniref:VOC family protein n=1 Tax=Listeria sp. ILCC792 TaxID=1918331 RepID=UPI000B596370|nr:VOC family protein [Listeria sp. ILCC792]
MKLHHVELYVGDLEASREFWSFVLEKLGYSLFSQWEKGFSYSDSDCYIVFVQAEEPFLPFGYHRARIGLNHLAFYEASRAKIDEWRSTLRERGVKLLYDERYPYAAGADYYAVFFEDPDGMKVEITNSSSR